MLVTVSSPGSASCFGHVASKYRHRLQLNLAGFIVFVHSFHLLGICFTTAKSKHRWSRQPEAHIVCKAGERLRPNLCLVEGSSDFGRQRLRDREQTRTCMILNSRAVQSGHRSATADILDASFTATALLACPGHKGVDVPLLHLLALWPAACRSCPQNLATAMWPTSGV